MKENIENKVGDSNSINKLIAFIIFSAVLTLALIISEPYFTEKAFKKEFEMITEKKIIENESLGTTISNGLITLVETKDGSFYRVTYSRRSLIDEFKGFYSSLAEPILKDGLNNNSKSLIISIEEKLGKNFAIIYTLE
jgi:hypothetical protein